MRGFHSTLVKLLQSFQEGRTRNSNRKVDHKLIRFVKETTVRESKQPSHRILKVQGLESPIQHLSQETLLLASKFQTHRLASLQAHWTPVR